jgi:type VI protein secretion system component VasK
MKKIDKLFKGLLITLSSLMVGFLAITIPFHLFNQLNDDGLRILFVLEIIVYFVIASTFLLIKDKKQQKIAKQKRKAKQRQEKIAKISEEWTNLAA